jgi:hypothetical protein
MLVFVLSLLPYIPFQSSGPSLYRKAGIDNFMINFDSDIRFGLPGMTKRICKGRVDTAGEA